MASPLELLAQWWAQAKQNSPLQQKSAVCISSIDADGFPSGRFVDLKAVDEQGVVFCTSLTSPKGQQIAGNNKVSMTAWWDHIGYQVRLQGIASPIADRDADGYWQSRSRAAQITTLLCAQSEPLQDYDALAPQLENHPLQHAQQPIPRPSDWGGYHIAASSIEFLTFEDNRLHHRVGYRLMDGLWQSSLLQP